MKRYVASLVAITLGFFVTTNALFGQASFTKTAEQVNKKMVKLFGAGGFKGLPSYGTGLLVSDDGYILTVNNHILTTTLLRVHLYDGRYYIAKVVARAPSLDVALVKIESEVSDLPHFDFAGTAKQPLAENGDWILAFSNQFQIATKAEPMSVQRGSIMDYAPLRGRRGVFDARFVGDVYFLDVVACNPGSAGGVVTDRRGRLLAILGRELKNTQTDTWINYAVPIQAQVEITRDGKKVTVDMATFLETAKKGTWVQGEKTVDTGEGGGYHGIVLVPNVVDVTPPFVEELKPGSPGAKAGLLPDDLIVYIDGELVTSIKMFRDIMKQVSAGTEVRLEVQRENKLQTIKLKLGDHPKSKKVEKTISSK